MTQLLPDVSLEEDVEEDMESAGESEQDGSSKELQNYRTIETSEDRSSEPQGSQSQPEGTASKKRRYPYFDSNLSVVPDRRPNLGKKLGPYVSDEVDAALEEAYLILRKRFGGDASKSLIVEAALRYALIDCFEKREDSELVQWFEQVLSSSQ